MTCPRCSRPLTSHEWLTRTTHGDETTERSLIKWWECPRHGRVEEEEVKTSGGPVVEKQVRVIEGQMTIWEVA